jgi:ParB family chromosome partitioning protein
VDRIRPNPNQPRSDINDAALHELAASVRRTGVLQPVLLRPESDGTFVLVAGERRWRAAQLAGLQTIPALVRHLDDAESFEISLIENLQREDLSPLDRAAAYQQFIDSFGVTTDELAARLGESRASVANYLRMLKLTEEVQDLLRTGQLGMGQARAISGISNPQRQLAIARLAVRRNLSVRQVEALAKGSDEPAARPTLEPRARDPHLSDVQKSLSKAIGLSVTLHPGKKKNAGRVVIHYNSLEEFDRIAERIGGRSALE